MNRLYTGMTPEEYQYIYYGRFKPTPKCKHWGKSIEKDEDYLLHRKKCY